MIIQIDCPCGRKMTACTLLVAPMVCPDCGFPNAARLPMPAISEKTRSRSKADHAGVVPEWIMAPILVYLTYVSAVIVAIGWSLATPSQSATTIDAPASMAMATHLEESRPSAQQSPPLQESAGAEEIEPKSYNESFTLPRRRSSIDDEEMIARPIKVGADDSAAPPRFTRAGMPIAWSLDAKPQKTGGLYLIPPVEIAQGEVGHLHFSLRRLRLSDETPRRLKLAVTPIAHDDVASILTKMGEGYRFATLQNQDLFFLQTLRKYDVVFLTCADVYAQDFQAALPLRKFVELGGTLYASDLRGDLVLAAFPEFRARVPVLPGVPQEVEAQIVDSGLQSHLGRKSIPLTFDAPGWRPAAFNPDLVKVCLTGRYRNQMGIEQLAPLLVKFSFGRGAVIFTSFHHAKNDSATVHKLLDYLVFASVSARSEARVRELMQRYDFAPADLRPVILNGGQELQGKFQHAGGGLQIALGFENQGAKLKLTLHSPTGQKIEHEDQGVYLIEVPVAVPGAWQYSVTPIELPHANFPVVVAVGNLKS